MCASRTAYAAVFAKTLVTQLRVVRLVSNFRTRFLYHNSITVYNFMQIDESVFDLHSIK